VTKSPKLGPLHIFFISLGKTITNEQETSAPPLHAIAELEKKFLTLESVKLNGTVIENLPDLDPHA
jgi:hypothetical protein